MNNIQKINRENKQYLSNIIMIETNWIYFFILKNLIFQNRKNYKNRKVPSLQKYQILFKHGKINLIYYRKYKLLGQVSENLKD